MLNEVELMNVNGGNYFDMYKDTDPKHSMYQVGQSIERYPDAIHLWTKNAVIINKKYEYGLWAYEYKPGHWISAEQIERLN